jgi:hypothetical protein
VEAAAAAVAARRYLGTQGHDGQVEVDGAMVTVTVIISRRTSLLHLVGVGRLTVTGHASARSIAGITTEEGP